MATTTTTTTRLLAAVLFALLCAPLAAYAEPSAATGLTPGLSTRRDLSGLNVTSVEAQAGNITRLDINAMTITKSWQGYYGNISGNIILADANNKSLYEWGNATSVTGEVFASRSPTINWAAIGCSNGTVILAEQAALGQSPADGDAVNTTFSGTTHPSFLVGMSNLTACPSTNAYSNGGAQNTTWHQILLADDSANTVYTTIIAHNSVGYDGNAYDFQLLVGQDGHQGGPSSTAYYFFAELG